MVPTQMSEFSYLTRPPSIEAIIELRSTLSEPATAEKCRAIAGRLVERFPSSQELRFVTAEVRLGESSAPPVESTNSLLGVRLSSSDGRWVVQAKADGLSVSRLVPYSGWITLRETLAEVWPIYSEIFRPQRVIRTGVRFLNRIEFGSESVDLDDFFTIGPRVPPSMPQYLLRHSSQVVVPIERLSAIVAVSQSSEEVVSSTGEVSNNVILDIDAFIERVLPAEDAEIWETLERLREAKNLAFFGSLTPKALERYK